MTDTPETNAAKRPQGLRACADGLDVNPDKVFAQKCMRHAADRIEQLERERDQWRNEHDRVVREYQHRLVVIGISVMEAAHYPENAESIHHEGGKKL